MWIFSSPSVRFYFPSIHSEDFMNYHDFKQQIISTLSDRLGSDVRITVSDILKNNDTHLDGLTILAPGSEPGAHHLSGLLLWTV